MANYKRILLKLSGEALAGPNKTGFDEATCIGVAKQVKKLVDAGIEVGIVTGGGNFWRGRTSENIDRTKADQIGMLATVMNCIYVSEIFRSVGIKTSVLTPFECGSFTKLFSICAVCTPIPSVVCSVAMKLLVVVLFFLTFSSISFGANF